MSPITTFISLAALFIATISAMPFQVNERAVSCPSGSFRMKYYYKNGDGVMVWNGQYATNIGGPLGSTTSISQAYPVSVDSAKNLIDTVSGYAACLNSNAWENLPANMTVFLPKNECQAGGHPLVECIKTPQYNLCSAGQSKVIQQCGKFTLFNENLISSAGGASCGPQLSLFTENCK